MAIYNEAVKEKKQLLNLLHSKYWELQTQKYSKLRQVATLPEGSWELNAMHHQDFVRASLTDTPVQPVDFALTVLMQRDSVGCALPERSWQLNAMHHQDFVRASLMAGDFALTVLMQGVELEKTAVQTITRTMKWTTAAVMSLFHRGHPITIKNRNIVFHSEPKQRPQAGERERPASAPPRSRSVGMSVFHHQNSVQLESSAAHAELQWHALATKTLLPKLAEVLTIVVECVNYIRTSALRHRIFSELCKEMGSEFEVLLYHSNIRWLSRGQVLSRVFAVCVELSLFLQEHQQCHADCFKKSEFILILAHLADIFAGLNHLNQNMQGGGFNIIEAEENLKAFQKTLPLWKRRTENNNFENFTLLDNCVRSKMYLESETFLYPQN
ncbi:hypothetical protein FHG87_022230 [Trinorchestia longiramus]|nr:hypothetical protein FHG87_022230 [Trinorchestia longiramus]